jgi:hypothetical protein
MQKNLFEELQSYKTGFFHYTAKRKHVTSGLKDMILQKNFVGAKD